MGTRYGIGVHIAQICMSLQYADVVKSIQKMSLIIAKSVERKDMPQLTLTNERISDEQLVPIIMEIIFEIDDEGMMWNGKAHPNISSGSNFGGAIPPVEDYKKRINELITMERDWFKESYDRPVKQKVTVIDNRMRCG